MDRLFRGKRLSLRFRRLHPDIKRARQVLKGLIRQGEVAELEGRTYALVSPQAVEELKGGTTMPTPYKIRSSVS